MSVLKRPGNALERFWGKLGGMSAASGLKPLVRFKLFQPLPGRWCLRPKIDRFQSAGVGYPAPFQSSSSPIGNHWCAAGLSLDWGNAKILHSINKCFCLSHIFSTT